MTDNLMADISDPGPTVIAAPGLAAFAFYLGGPTPHVWTPAQIDRQELRYAMPVWVAAGRPDTAAAGAADGQDAAADMHALGIPAGVAVRVDMETLVMPAYLRAFRAEINRAHYWQGPYGSADTVFGNPHGGAGWWVADWTGHPHDYPHPFVSATQYASAAQDGAPWDLSELAPEAFAHLWDRKPPAPPPAPAWTVPAAATLQAALSAAGQVLAEIKAHPNG